MSSLSKLGGKSWSEPGLQPLSSDALKHFQNDAEDVKLTNSVGDLLQLTRQRASRQFVGDSTIKNSSTLPKKINSNNNNNNANNNINNNSNNNNANNNGLLTTASTSSIKGTNNEFTGMKSAKYQNVHERPPRRVEISYLENELTQMVKTVMQPLSDDIIYQPHKEKMMLVQNRILDELQILPENTNEEPWLDGIVKSECLKDLCDEVGLRLTDMLSVSSAELGNVLRKLRYTYDQSFLQLLSSWKDLRLKYVHINNELNEATITIEELTEKINERDFNIREQIDLEIDEIKKDFEYDREQDKEKIRQHEIQMDQMTSTLKNLNAIFKTMQADVDAARTADTYARCSRLEREVADLESQVIKAEKVRKELDEEKEKCNQLQLIKDRQSIEIESLKLQIIRRDATIGELMERETLRNAEIEKLTRMAAQRQENDEDLDLDPVATSVLCIKCKKSLDDISSIREAILGKNKVGKNQKLACQSYRILLPNNKGKKSFRKNSWLKACMRSILTSKMTETLSVMPIGENVTTFPSFVYSWFEPPLEFSTEHHSIINSYQQQADENRWGFYYGIKTLTKDNAEAKLFWSLLDENQGEDGLLFVCHCLSIVLSIGGPNLWKQFGNTMNHSCISVNDELLINANDQTICPIIWLELETAYAAVKIILVRALESQINETIDAIELLKSIPEIPNPLSNDGENNNTNNELNDNEEKLLNEKEENSNDNTNNNNSNDIKKEVVNATHIDLFIWLRIMMQRFQDEQCHRQAAIRLMFDTASMGALIPTAPKMSPRSNNNSNGNNGNNNNIIDDSIYQTYDSENPQVYFPQFTAVVRTLYPQMSLSEIAELYGACYVEGEGRVTANVFTEIAGRRHLFAKSLKLGPLPLFLYETNDNSGIPLSVQSNGDNNNANNANNNNNVNTININGMDYHFDANNSMRLRSQIGSLVHQRFALLQPEVEILAKTLPGKWRTMIVDACESVKSALQEYFVIMKTKKRNSLLNSTGNNISNNNNNNLPLTSLDGSMLTNKMRSTSSEFNSNSQYSKPIDKYIDGLQPFIQYHRLLALVILVKSFNENSILPISFILDGEGQHQSNDTNTTNTTNNSNNSNNNNNRQLNHDITSFHLNTLSIKKVEKVLSSLEDSIFTHSIKHNAKQKYKRFEKFRLSFFARKVQNAFRTFLTKDSAIPRTLRYIIRPGYLGGGGHLLAEILQHQHQQNQSQLQNQNQSQIQSQIQSLPLLKSRRVYLEPWILQLLVSNIYAYKLTYDMKAMKMSQPLVSLGNATSSLLLMFFSSIDLVERTMHDLCLGIQTYMHGCPRLRLFASFLGFGEVEEPLGTILVEEFMLTSYLELLAIIHKEVSFKKYYKYSSIVPILFPVSEDPLTRIDKKDVWFLPLTTLTRALGQWSGMFKGFKSDIWENALTRIRRTKDGLTEVDDFLWVIMMTLAKTIANRYRKCEDQAKNYTLKELKLRDLKASNNNNNNNNNRGLSSFSSSKKDLNISGGGGGSVNSGFVGRTTSGILADHALEEQKLFQIKFPHSPNITSLQNSLNNIHGKTIAINDTNNSNDELNVETDLQQCCTSFIPIYSNYRHCNYKLYTNLLQKCILWDTYSGECLLESQIGDDNISESENKSIDNVNNNNDNHEFKEENKIINHRSSLYLQSAVPPILSLRYFTNWWNTQKDLVTNEIKEIESYLASSVKKNKVPNRGAPTSRGNTFLAEIERLSTEVKRCQFRLEQILSDVSTTIQSSNFILGEVNDQETAYSIEVCSLIGILFGTLSECLKYADRPFPRDSWKAGRKLHLDRAQAYLMQVQPNLNR